jgi:hypothetical protein
MVRWERPQAPALGHRPVRSATSWRSACWAAAKDGPTAGGVTGCQRGLVDQASPQLTEHVRPLQRKAAGSVHRRAGFLGQVAHQPGSRVRHKHVPVLARLPPGGVDRSCPAGWALWPGVGVWLAGGVDGELVGLLVWVGVGVGSWPPPPGTLPSSAPPSSGDLRRRRRTGAADSMAAAVRLDWHLASAGAGSGEGRDSRSGADGRQPWRQRTAVVPTRRWCGHETLMLPASQALLSISEHYCN